LQDRDGHAAIVGRCPWKWDHFVPSTHTSHNNDNIHLEGKFYWPLKASKFSSRASISSIICKLSIIQLYLSILSPARPAGLSRARPAHEPYWTCVGRDLEAREIFLVRVRPEMLFLVVLHYKIRGWPAQARARPENWGPTRPVGWSWAGFFRPEITEFFSSPARTRPDPKNDQVYIKLSWENDQCRKSMASWFLLASIFLCILHTSLT
jgi:hypothetical protein